MFYALSCERRSFNAIVKTANSFSRSPLWMVSPHHFTQAAALTPCLCFRCPLHILYPLHFVACRQLVRHLRRGFAGEGRCGVVRARVFTELRPTLTTFFILNGSVFLGQGGGSRHFFLINLVWFILWFHKDTPYTWDCFNNPEKAKVVPVIQFSLLPLA